MTTNISDVADRIIKLDYGKLDTTGQLNQGVLRDPVAA